MSSPKADIRKKMISLYCQGRAEQGVFDIADENESFEAYSVRPCGIFPKQHTLKSVFLTTFVLPTMRVEDCSAAMVKICKSGHKQRIVMHNEARKIGQRLLQAETMRGK
jgi:hypothetical protein